MKKNILDYICKCEGWKTGIKSLHWASKNLPQHELCDKIADRIAEFQDQVAEVEQSITGKLPLNKLKGTGYKVKDLRTFVQDVLDDTNTFYKSLKNDNYTGMRSDCESFLSDMQRFLYLVDFTLKEELKRSLREAMYKNISDDIDFEVDKFKGRVPKSMKARINRIYSIVNKYGVGSRLYRDDHWQAVGDYIKVISSLGCEVNVKPCANLDWADSMHSDGGYTDHAEDGMPRSKQYHISITFDDGMNIKGYIKCMAAGTMQDPFSAYDTCMVLWPSNGRGLAVESKVSGRKIIIREDQLGKMLSEEIINEAAAKMSDGTAMGPGEFANNWLPNSIKKLRLDEFGKFFNFVNERLPIIKDEIKYLEEVNNLRRSINDALYNIRNAGISDAVFYRAKERLLEPLKELNKIFPGFKTSMYDFAFSKLFADKMKNEDSFDHLFSQEYLDVTHNNINNVVRELESILSSACPDNPSINRVGVSGERVGIRREPSPSINKPSSGIETSSTGGKGERPRRPRIVKGVPVSKGKIN